MSALESQELSGIDVHAKLTAVRTAKDDKKGFDVIITTPTRKAPLTTSFPVTSDVKESIQTITNVDVDETITVHLFDQESKVEVKTMEIPVRDLQSNLTSTHIFHDGITLLIEYEITREGRKVTSVDDKLDEIINIIGFGEKPWYLEVATLYSALKLTLMRIFFTTISSDFIKNANGAVAALAIINFLKSSTDLIQSLTPYKKIFSETEAKDLLEHIDTHIVTGLERLDFLTDHLRSQLANALLDLRAAVAHHLEWAKDSSEKSSTALVQITSSKLAEVKQYGLKFIASVRDILDLFKESQISLNSLLLAAYRYYEATANLVGEKVKNYSKNGKVFLTSFVDKKLAEDSTWAEILTAGSTQATTILLLRAQPYVHKAVTWSTPYLLKALNISKPYLLKAAPYAQAVAENISKKAQANSSADQLLKAVAIKGKEALNYSASYAIPEPLAETYESIFAQ